MNKIEAVFENSAMSFEDLKEFNPQMSDKELHKWADMNKKNHALDLLFIYIDGIRLDKFLARKVNLNYFGLWCSLLDLYEENFEPERKNKEYVWSKAKIDNNTKILPLLLCPDDWDFSCTVIVAEVVSDGKTVTWQRLGLDVSGTRIATPNMESVKFNLDEQGAAILFERIKWFTEIGPLTFDEEEYLKCIDDFRRFKIKR